MLPLALLSLVTIHADTPVRRHWAGTITMVRGIDTDAALNVTVTLDPAAVVGGTG